MDSFKVLESEVAAGVLLINVGVQYVTSKDVVLQVFTELPPGHQLHVDLIASLHLQHHNLKASTVNSVMFHVAVKKSSHKAFFGVQFAI